MCPMAVAESCVPSASCIFCDLKLSAEIQPPEKAHAPSF